MFWTKRHQYDIGEGGGFEGPFLISFTLPYTLRIHPDNEVSFSYSYLDHVSRQQFEIMPLNCNSILLIYCKLL